MSGLFNNVRKGDKFLRRDGMIAEYVCKEDGIWHRLKTNEETYMVMGDYVTSYGFDCDGQCRADNVELDREIIRRL